VEREREREDVPPFGFNNPQTGEVEGFDVDLGTYIAERLGVEPVFREATTDNRVPLLVDGTIDLILSTMTITEERDLEIDFSEPYYIANGDILAPRGPTSRGSMTSTASGCAPRSARPTRRRSKRRRQTPI
jgi:ABC-type amino acid transport substrate-binding protein